MTILNYIIAYWAFSLFVTVGIRLYNGKAKELLQAKTILLLIVLAPLALPFLPIIFIEEAIRKQLKKRKDRKEEQIENEKKVKLGLHPDEEYVTFQRMGGAGVIICRECGHKERITSFVHGSYSCEIGRQCPHCHAFVTEYNESKKYHVFGEAKDDFVCPNCGKVIRKKEEPILKGNDDPLFCPKCHSARLHYWMEYIT